MTPAAAIAPIWLTEIHPGQLSDVGGKALNLGRMARAGLPVPGGFVLPTGAYHRRDDPEVLVSLLAAYAELDGGPVAVRSSAAAEDLPDTSFAGQYQTLLNVRGEQAVIEAVRRCWDSLHSAGAAAYRDASGAAGDPPAMAVIVQRLIPADAAGVLFTRDPADLSAERMRVEACWGLGQAVVSGKVDPDSWVLSHADGAVLGSHIGEKHLWITPDGERVVPERMRSQPSLQPEELIRLAELGRRVETHFGAPQDVEWAVSGGELFLLQSRPITGAGDEREQVRREEIAFVRRRAEADGTVWSRYGLAETLPEPLPLTWSLWRQFMSASGGYGRLYRQLGYRPDPDLDEDGVVDLIAGRLYYNLSREARLYYRSLPYAYPFEKLRADPQRALAPELELSPARAPKDVLVKLPGGLFQVWGTQRSLERAARDVPPRLEADVYPRMTAFHRSWLERDLTAIPSAELPGTFESCRAVLFDQFASEGLKPGLLSAVALRKLVDFLQPALGAEGARQAADLALRGVTLPEEYDLSGALRRLGTGELETPGFIAGFGHRCPGEMELANPRWRESPTLVDDLMPFGQGRGARGEGREGFRVQGSAGGGQWSVVEGRWAEGSEAWHYAGEGEPVRGYGGVGEGAEGGRSTPPHHLTTSRPHHPTTPPPTLEQLLGAKRVNRRKLEALVARARRMMALREVSKHCFLLGYEVLRRVLLEIDRRMALQGGVFYLEPEELDAVTTGEEVRSRIAERRKRRSLVLGLEAPRVLFSSDPEAIGRGGEHSPLGKKLQGTGVSPGVALGPALVLRSPEGVPPDVRGFLLVCPAADAGWVPLFLRARGVVMETGGTLSHGAIVARELGLPAITGIPGACARLRSGQALRIDGATGCLEIGEESGRLH